MLPAVPVADMPMVVLGFTCALLPNIVTELLPPNEATDPLGELMKSAFDIEPSTTTGWHAAFAGEAGCELAGGNFDNEVAAANGGCPVVGRRAPVLFMTWGMLALPLEYPGDVAMFEAR